MRYLAFASLLAALVAAPALAGPFAEVGDRQLRQDVDLLKAAGLVEGPVDSWPLPWAQIDSGLDKARDGRTLDPWLKAAVDRLDRLGDLAAQRKAVDIRLGVTNDVSVARDFGTLARGKADASTRVEFNSDVVSVALGVGYRAGAGGQDNSYLHFEPSQIAVRFGNWAVYGGYTEQWYGPGHDGALLWSNSARPIPKVGLKRLVPERIDFPVLRWLGPVQFEIFGGVLNGPRRDYANILTFGTRVGFEPARGLAIGLNRAQMLCGDGRPCGLKQISSSFIGFGNADNPTTGDQVAFLQQAGNQIAGWDISYTQRFGPVSAKVYVEAEAEDFDNVILEQYSRMVGATLQGPWGRKGASWVATVEYADTQAASLFNGTPLEKLTGGETIYPGSMYNNSLYFDGFTYRGRPIGYWTDGDSRSLSFSAAVTDTRNRRWYGSVRSVHLNINDIGNPPIPANDPTGAVRGLVSYRISANAEKFAIVTAGAELPLAFGDVRIEGRLQTDSPNTPGYRDRQAALEVQFRQRF
ncbi:capsule assembly Wzi family protein [Sandarakinorhabdus sp. DWP1-3-1]|uniref:capsule assembly Wzi family protein n=1 Tax=Sandarakinorhabdus sp. DWP1-3-1 TaxID=2804627 RepID=UPI003CF4E334